MGVPVSAPAEMYWNFGWPGVVGNTDELLWRPDQLAVQEARRLVLHPLMLLGFGISTPAQAAEFMKVIGPIAKRAGVGVACCDSFGWTQSDAYAQAIEADPEARRHLAVFTGHGYASAATRPTSC